MSYSRWTSRALPLRRTVGLPRGRFVAPSTRTRVFRHRGRAFNLQTPAQIEGLGFSLKPPKRIRRAFTPPKRIRKAFGAVGRVLSSGAAIAASSLIPGAGLIIGSRRAPRFLRAPKGVRPFVRKAAKVQLVAAGAIAAGLLAPTLLTAGAKLLPLAAKFLPKAGSTTSTEPSPGEGYSSGGVVDYSGGGGGGGEGAPAPEMMAQPEEADTAAAPRQAGGGALVIGGIALALLAMSQRRRG